MSTKKIEQARQYKIYTREVAGNEAENSVQVLGGELWYD